MYFCVCQVTMPWQLVLYGIGLDPDSMQACSKILQARAEKDENFTGQVVTICSDFLVSPDQVYNDLKAVRGSKMAVLLYRPDNFKDLEGLRTFMLALTCLCGHQEKIQFCVCYPIPNQAAPDHFEQCDWQGEALEKLESQTNRDLKTFELDCALREEPELRFLIPEVTSLNPHRISPDCCERIAVSVYCKLVSVVHYVQGR